MAETKSNPYLTVEEAKALPLSKNPLKRHRQSGVVLEDIAFLSGVEFEIDHIGPSDVLPDDCLRVLNPSLWLGRHALVNAAKILNIRQQLLTEEH